MIIKLKNPYNDLPTHGCFCCSPRNPIVLKLEFWFDDERRVVETRWVPSENFQGYHNVLHGGIQSTLMDEVPVVHIHFGRDSWRNFKDGGYLQKTSSNLEWRGEGLGRIEKMVKRVVVVETELFDGNGMLCSTGQITTLPIQPK
jgi:acyl-coenzyme A thioesterase PaaI-like protein